MIGIIDYDAGNIRSVEKALAYLGEETVVSRDPQVLLKSDKVILPGCRKLRTGNGESSQIQSGSGN